MVSTVLWTGPLPPFAVSERRRETLWVHTDLPLHAQDPVAVGGQPGRVAAFVPGRGRRGCMPDVVVRLTRDASLIRVPIPLVRLMPDTDPRRPSR